MSVAERREAIGEWVDSLRVQRVVVALILFNAILLGIEAMPDIAAGFGPWLGWLEAIVVAVFVVEIGLRWFARGWAFFRSGWNVFDVAVVGIALVPASGPLAVLRTLRVLRVLRLLSTIKRLRFLVESLLEAIPSIGWIALLLFLVFYVFAVMGTALFGASFPDWFGSLDRSLFTLFQVMTLESWSMGIARPVMEVYPWAWIFFVPFILLTAFTVLNLFIGIIVNTMQSMHWSEEQAQRETDQAKAHDERERIMEELHAIRRRLDDLSPPADTRG